MEMIGTGASGFCSRAMTEVGEQSLSTFTAGITGDGCLAREIACSAV